MRRESELEELRRQAEALAHRRRERATSAHLLCAIADRGGPVWQLLKSRRLTDEALLKAARTASDDVANPVEAALRQAVDVASRMRAPQATAIHLLVGLLSNRTGAAYRALDQFGLDVARLRVVAMNAALGMLGREPIVTRHDERPLRAASAAVTVPLTPRPIVARRSPAASQVTDTAERSDAGEPVNPPTDVLKSTPVPRNVRKEPAAGTTSSVRKASASPQKRRGTRRGPTRFALDRRKYKLLCTLGRNLTQLAAKGELTPVVGEGEPVQRVLDVLAKSGGNNPCLVGPPGVGKTSLVHALAHFVVASTQGGELDERIVVEIAVGELLGGTGVRGALAQRIVDLQKEVAASDGRVVLFLDDVHQLFGGGAEEALAEMKRFWSRGELPTISATSPEHYTVLEADAGLERCVCRLDVEEPTQARAMVILEHAKHRLQAHHGVAFGDAACKASAEWSSRYVTGRALPDKAISILDLAGARCRRRGGNEVQPPHVAEVVGELTGVPEERLLESDGERLLKLEAVLAERIVGHKSQIASMSRIIRRNAAGLGGDRPIGTFLLLGPTGVGKTECAKALAAVLFGSPNAMTRLDLSEFSEAHAVARLIGAPPGYIGHDSGGQLTESIRRRPYQVLLLDELEKAHPEVLETFLPLFDEGHLTDGRGRTVDFTKTLILLTSNIGAAEAAQRQSRPMGFGAQSTGEDGASERVRAAARAALAPEFFNRLDEVLVFDALQREHVVEVARRLLQRLADSLLEQRGIELEIEGSVVELLLDAGGFDPAMGARPMRRAIARSVEAPLAEALLRGEIGAGSGEEAGERVLLRAAAGQLEIVGANCSALSAAQ